MRYKMTVILGFFIVFINLARSQELMISAGYHHTCAILENGKAKCWGDLRYGETTLPPGLENMKWKAISVGWMHICAILESGEAKCLGNSGYGQTTLPSGLENAKWKAISAGFFHTCAILENGEAKCWGMTGHGQTTLPSGLENAKWKAISAGFFHTCGILESGEAKCWGSTKCGQTTLPTDLENAKWKAISVGAWYTCAILENGKAKCWGNSGYGQTILPLGLENAKWKVISTGDVHTCAILESGEVKCWGDPSDGKTILPSGLENAKWKAISAGGLHTCAILANDEAIHCWGNNENGRSHPIISLLPEYPFGVLNIELGLEKTMAAVNPVKKAFLERVLKILNKLKKPGEEFNRANYHALNQRLFLLNALGPFMEDLTSAYEKEHVVPKYLVAREQANIENEIKCLADLDCNASLKILSLELIQITVEALKGQTASNEDHALMENLTAELGKSLAQGGENLSQVMGIFDSAPGKKLFGAFAQSPFTRGFGLMIQSLVEYLRGAK